MDIQGKVILISNRNVNRDRTDISLFGDDLNPLGAEEINLATAEYNKQTKKWKLALLSDPENPNYTKPVSREVFKAAAQQARTDEAKKNWVLFVHGFNQSLEKNLLKCREIMGYGVNVAAFSWPSNPGPNELWKKHKEYKRARKNARRSVLALERTMEKMASYMEEFTAPDCQINLSLVIHSLGNYLMQHYINSADFSQETRIFRNVMFHQADVENHQHARWLERLTDHTRVFVTINENDKVLYASDLVNSARLGNTVQNLNADGVTYIDFTEGKMIGNSHRPWNKPGDKNDAVYKFYKEVFHSRRWEQAPGWEYDPATNSHQLIERSVWEEDDED